MTRLTLNVTEADGGRRVKYLIRSALGVSQAQYTRAKLRDGVKLNGQTALANDTVRAGDLLEITLEETDPPAKTVLPEEGDVPIVYEDDQILIIDKPAPLACQASDRQPTGTLENRLARLCGADFVFRPLNRLDKGTSGLMAAAKTAHAAQKLQRLLHTPDFRREYLAAAEGILTGGGVWNAPIAKEEAATVRRVIDWERGRPAVTHWQALAHGNGRTLLRLRLETGRTHQIRVHASAAGHPLVGDFLYGTETAELPGRFALHSAYLSLIHPVTGERMAWESPMPEILKRLLDPPEGKQ